jgi:hypothetical protein
MIKTTPEQNKTLVLQAFDTLFNKRDYKAAERYWSSNYIQHSAHIAPGRDGIRTESLPLAVSVSGKRDFGAREKCAETTCRR